MEELLPLEVMAKKRGQIRTVILGFVLSRCLGYMFLNIGYSEHPGQSLYGFE